jgi:hypothetical protein
VDVSCFETTVLNLASCETERLWTPVEAEDVAVAVATAVLPEVTDLA